MRDRLWVVEFQDRNRWLPVACHAFYSQRTAVGEMRLFKRDAPGHHYRVTAYVPREAS